MIAVGIKNLRNSLSKYIKMAAEGETIIVTDHNRVVAEIVQPKNEPGSDSLMMRYLNEQIESGRIIPATKNIKIRGQQRSGTQCDEKLLQDIYEESRAERL